LSPAYDIVNTAFYDGFDQQLALSINGKKPNLDDVIKETRRYDVAPTTPVDVPAKGRTVTKHCACTVIGGAFSFGNGCQATDIIRGRFRHFFQMHIEIIG